MLVAKKSFKVLRQANLSLCNSVAENLFRTQAKVACVLGSYAGHFSLTQVICPLALSRIVLLTDRELIITYFGFLYM